MFMNFSNLFENDHKKSDFKGHTYWKLADSPGKVIL